MNQADYASLEVSKKLVENGIVMETGMVWVDDDENNWRIVPTSYSCWRLRSVPAPSMSELWRELPEGAQIRKVNNDRTLARMHTGAIPELFFNPSDALAELLVWVKEQSSNHPKAGEPT